MDIGITTRFKYSFFSNGLSQNIVTLYELLERSGFSPFFLDFTPRTKESEVIDEQSLKGKKILSIKEFKSGSQNIDLLIGAGVTVDSHLKSACLKKNKNVKIASLHYGNNLCTAIWDWVSDKEMKGDFHSTYQDIYDEAWISEHYSFQSEFIESYEGVKVKIMPYLWSPRFIEEDAKSLNAELNYKPSKKPNIAVMEPNINFTKTFVPPFFTIRHLLNTTPDIFNKAILFDTHRIVASENKTLVKNHILGDIVIKKHLDKLIFDPRERTASIFNRDNPLILSHQHLNALNYTYLEALNYGYPLVHNSPFFKDYGYYYSDFNIIEAADQVRFAIENHNDNIEEYKNRAKDIVWRYSAQNPSNAYKIKKLILDLVK